jgi:hypothetical protein
MLNTVMSAAIVAAESHLTLHSILVDIPHNAPAFVVYALSAGAIAWVFKAGLKKPDSDEGTDD